jgi:hypothetical protein
MNQIIFEKGSEPVPCEIYIDMTVFSDTDNFDPADLTEKIKIQPTRTWRKGDMIRENLYRKETCWTLITSRIRTFELEASYQELMHILDGKIQILSDYAKENNCCIKIEPVIKVDNAQPVIIISREIQETLLMLNATMEFDIYFD